MMESLLQLNTVHRVQGHHLIWSTKSHPRTSLPLGRLSHMVQRALGSKHVESDPHEIKHGAWMMPYTNEEILMDKFDELLASNALLLGSVSYQLLAVDCPTITDEGLREGFAARMNRVRKYVN